MGRRAATAMAGHLQWTRHGQVWATWRLRPPAYGMRPLREKETVRDLHRVLLRGLDGQGLLLGVVAATDPAEVVEAMIEDVDLDRCGAWVDEAEATLERLAEIPLGQRTFWLAVPLANTGLQRLARPGAAGLATAQELLALPVGRPSAAQVDVRLAQADRVAAAIPSVFDPLPATTAEQVWLAAHCERRGLPELPLPSRAPGAVVEPALRSGSALGEPVLDEGGQGDLSRTSARRLNPLTRRFVKVADPNGPAHEDGTPEASYQVLMAVGEMPAGGIAFPGSEYLARLDKCGVDVDWAVRLEIHNRDKVLARTRSAVRNLSDQYDQQDGASSTGSYALDVAGDLLQQYEAAFANDSMEIEVAHTTLLAVGAPDAVTAQEHAKTVTVALAGLDIRVDRPVGAMSDLWWQMQAGVPSSGLTRQLAQLTTSTDYSMACPVTASVLGDRVGIPVAVTRSTSRPSVVLHALDQHSKANVSGSFAVAGELGGGKTYTLLSVCGAVADRGGQFLAIDRSAEGEYANLAREVGDHTIVDMAAPAFTLDPLRLIADPGDAAQAVETFLLPLTGIHPQSVAGDTLSEVLSGEYRARYDLRCLPDVVEHLAAAGCELGEAASIAARLRSFARRQLGRAVFDRDLPPMPMSSSAIVWLTRSLALPSREELNEQHLFAAMSIEKLFGRAYYALVAALARTTSGLDRTRFTLLACDEAHQINSSPESQLAVTLFIREGRRKNAAVGLGSHSPMTDFGDSTQRGLIRTRLVTRHTDLALARESLTWLGLEEGDPAFQAHVETLMKDTSPIDPATGKVAPERRGEAFMRDVHGGIEPVRILGPALSRRRRAMDTTPGAHPARSSSSSEDATSTEEPLVGPSPLEAGPEDVPRAPRPGVRAATPGRTPRAGAARLVPAAASTGPA